MPAGRVACARRVTMLVRFLSHPRSLQSHVLSRLFLLETGASMLVEGLSAGTHYTASLDSRCHLYTLDPSFRQKDECDNNIIVYLAI